MQVNENTRMDLRSQVVNVSPIITYVSKSYSERCRSYNMKHKVYISVLSQLREFINKIQIVPIKLKDVQSITKFAFQIMLLSNEKLV